ncbi:MAG: glycolate oxidase subunit GlcF [Pseudomonadota bacterium]
MHLKTQRRGSSQNNKINTIIDSCVQCGLCTASCPTYLLLQDERDGPRGRISMIKDMLAQDQAPSQHIKTHIDRCLSCHSCMSSCPSQVDYMHLIDAARLHIETKSSRSLKDRFIRLILSKILPHPGRFRFALLLAVFLRPFRNLFKYLGLKEVRAMLELAPSTPLVSAQFSSGGIAKPNKSRTKRVVLVSGCVQQILRPQINDATLRLLARQGVEVILPPLEKCCGGLAHNLGHRRDAIKSAQNNIDVWYDLMQYESLDAIIFHTAGCGAMVKDYSTLLQDDPAYARRANDISALAQDITEFLANYDQDAPHRWSSIKVAYLGACALEHTQRIHEQPRALLQHAGYTVLEIPESHICCGSAGTYNILQPDLSQDLQQRKIKNIESVKPDIIAAGNIGCISHLKQKTEIPIVHTVELIDWALGGPCPEGLESLREKVTDVESLYQKKSDS